MVQQKDKEVLRQLSTEFISLKNDEKEQKKRLSEKLKQDATYQELTTQKKQIMEQLKAQEEEVAQEELDEITITTTNIKIIKTDFATKLDVKPTVVSDILKYRKQIHDKPSEDLLEAVSTCYVELYNLD